MKYLREVTVDKALPILYTIRYYDEEDDREFTFLTNAKHLSALDVWVRQEYRQPAAGDFGHLPFPESTCP